MKQILSWNINWEAIWSKALLLAAILCVIWLLVYALVWLIQTSDHHKEYGKYEIPSRPEDKVYNKQPGEPYADVYSLSDLSTVSGVTVKPAKYYRVVDGKVVERENETQNQ